MESATREDVTGEVAKADLAVRVALALIDYAGRLYGSAAELPAAPVTDRPAPYAVARPERRRAADAADRVPLLTQRELEVLGLVAEGLSNRRIATLLGITEKTVKNHLAAVFAKLDVSGRTEAALYAVRTGLARG